jgi:hypothetical protein
LSGKETINLGMIDTAYKKYFKLINVALISLRNNKAGRFKDLINVNKLFDDNQSSLALKHLQKIVNKDDFTGVAAAELNQAIDQIEFESPLSDKDKIKLSSIKTRLTQNAQQITTGQTIEHKGE